MISPKALKVYGEVIQKRFPCTIITMDPDCENCLAVFGIPDDQCVDYHRFMIEDVHPIMDKEIVVIMHTESTTKEYYPDIYKRLVELREFLQTWRNLG